MHPTQSVLTRACLGACAGVVGTFALQAIRSLHQQYVPQLMTPMREDPGKFMVEQAERALPESAREKIPEEVEGAASMSLHLSYGALFGALFGAVRGHTDHPVLEGIVLGAGVWAIGYAGWLPAAGLTEPIWKQEPSQAIPEVARHAVYGIATAAAYEAIHSHV